MEESTTYQWIVSKGRAQEARRILLIQGELKLGPPDEATRTAIEQTDDLTQLEGWLRRIMTSGSWQDLLAPSTSRRRKSQRKRDE